MPKTHMRIAVSVGDSQVPACGSFGWETTDKWRNVTCQTCQNRRRHIDAKNKRLVERFIEMAKSQRRV